MCINILEVIQLAINHENDTERVSMIHREAEDCQYHQGRSNCWNNSVSDYQPRISTSL